MDEPFKVYVDRLRDDKPETWDIELEPDFLGVNEEELSFTGPVHVCGKAFVTDDELVIQLRLAAKASMPCSMCNQIFERLIEPEPVVHCVPVKEVKGAIFDWSPVAREAILLEIPHYAKCGGDHCPQQGEMERYMKAGEKGEDSDGTHQPFADLKL